MKKNPGDPTQGMNGRTIINFIRNITSQKLNELDESVAKYKLAKALLDKNQSEYSAKLASFTKSKDDHRNNIERMKQDVRKVIDNDQRSFLSNLQRKKIDIAVEGEQGKLEDYQKLVEKIRSVVIFKEEDERNFHVKKEKIMDLIKEAQSRNHSLKSKLRFRDQDDIPRNNLAKPQSIPESVPVPTECTPPEYTLKSEIESQYEQNGNVVKKYTDSHTEHILVNGVRYEEYPNGYKVIFYTNGDVKQIFPDAKTTYFYAETNAIHTTLPDKTEIYRFSNGQKEKHHVDGTVSVSFPDGTKVIAKAGKRETVFPDGTKITEQDSNKVLQHPGGHSFRATNGKYCLIRNK